VGLLSGVSEEVISRILCGYLDRYSGPQCRNLGQAIADDLDLYGLWTENAAGEGVRRPREVRRWARMFPGVRRMMTPQNVKRWLREHGREDITLTVENSDGGEAWLAWQVERFRTGLWDE